MSSCKQVRFVYEAFCKMSPGVPLMHLYGKQKQMVRTSIYTQFCRKTNACLFATDIASRGLDFPAVDWVISLDCPENVDTYIHRVGRSARYNLKGQSLLMLDSSEKAIVEEIQAKGIPIGEIKVNPAKTVSITPQMAGLVVLSNI
jgi:ATP-dependent RNA helicase DDX10/DBP4